MANKITEAVSPVTLALYLLVGVVAIIGIIGLFILTAGMAALWFISSNGTTTSADCAGCTLAPVAFQWTSANVTTPSFGRTAVHNVGTAGIAVTGLYQVTGGFVNIQFNQLVVAGCSNWTNPDTLFVPASQVPVSIRPPTSPALGADFDYRFSALIGNDYGVLFVASTINPGVILFGVCNNDVFQTLTLSTVYSTM